MIILLYYISNHDADCRGGGCRLLCVLLYSCSAVQCSAAKRGEVLECVQFMSLIYERE